jgi:hypothetical protein
VVAITGSNGKTSVKELLAHLIGDPTVVRSPRSYNSKLGVPLSVLQFPLGQAAASVSDRLSAIRAETGRLDWLFSTHTTSRSAAELLLFLHAGMMVSKGGGRSTVKAGRSA